MARTKKSVQVVVQEEYPDFANEVAGLAEGDLNNRLAGLAKALEQSETAKEDDAALEDAKELATELGAPYKDAKKAIRMKSKYIIALLKDKGADA